MGYYYYLYSYVGQTTFAYSILPVDDIITGTEAGPLECYYINVNVTGENKEWELKKLKVVFGACEYKKYLPGKANETVV